MTELEKRRKNHFALNLGKISNMIAKAINEHNPEKIRKFSDIIRKARKEMEEVESTLLKREGEKK